MDLDRIVVSHEILGGVPCIRGTRIPVATVVSLLADDLTPREIVADYPQLTVDDVREAPRFAARSVEARELPVPPTAGSARVGRSRA